MRKMAILPVLFVLALSGCQQRMTYTEMAGVVVGGAIGGYTGSMIGHGIWQKTFMASGVAAGAAAGYITAQKLEQSDFVLYQQTTNQGLASANDGSELNWSNPETGHSGLFRPIRTYSIADGRTCRSYRATVALNDEIQHGNGTACQKPDGSWQIVSDDFS